MPFSMTGHTGELRCGYQVAARLGKWSCDGKRVDAVASYLNELWLDGDLTLRLDVGSRVFVWRGVEVLTTKSPIGIRVSGKPEVR